MGSAQRSATRRTVVGVLVLLLALAAGSSSPDIRAAQTPRPIHLTDPVPDPHQPGIQWFAATGHTLRAPFLDYWTRYGGLAQFGYPLTEPFIEAPNYFAPNLPVVQYFERARFEYHREYDGSGYSVLLGLLGRAVHAPDPRAPPASDVVYFAETGHNLSGAFRSYWETHGGLFVNGYPISEPFDEVSPTDGRVYRVQYFERARFEYHPEYAGTAQEVLLGLLGTQQVQQRGYFYGWYPQDGRAADFAWIAGGFLPLRMCAAIECTCPLFHHGDGSIYVEPLGPGWAAARAAGLSLYGSRALVLFGHVDSSTQPDAEYGCPAGYVLDRAQRNPSP